MEFPSRIILRWWDSQIWRYNPWVPFGAPLNRNVWKRDTRNDPKFKGLKHHVVDNNGIFFGSTDCNEHNMIGNGWKWTILTWIHLTNMWKIHEKTWDYISSETLFLAGIRLWQSHRTGAATNKQGLNRDIIKNIPKTVVLFPMAHQPDMCQCVCFKNWSI